MANFGYVEGPATCRRSIFLGVRQGWEKRARGYSILGSEKCIEAHLACEQQSVGRNLCQLAATLPFLGLFAGRSGKVVYRHLTLCSQADEQASVVETGKPPDVFQPLPLVGRRRVAKPRLQHLA